MSNLVQGAGKKVLGPVGGILFALLVSAACLGSLNINVYVTGRLTKVAAQHGYIPRFLAGAPAESSTSSDLDHEPRNKAAMSNIFAHIEHATIRVFGDHGYWDTPM